MRKAINQMPGDKAQFLIFGGVEYLWVLCFLMPTGITLG